MNKKYTGLRFFIFSIVLFLSVFYNVKAKEHPVWWSQIADEAQKNGYSLLMLDDLKKNYESKDPFLIIDVRTEYEYNEGHLPGAVCMEFDPGDNLQLKDDKRQAFLKLLGPDKEKKIIIYCRSFR